MTQQAKDQAAKPEDTFLLLLGCLGSIEKFNSLAGNFDKPVDPTLESKMLRDEVDEYISAVHEDNKAEIADALGDTFVVLWGTICKHGLRDKFVHILQRICCANMSKFCTTEQEVEDSIKALAERGFTNVKIEEIGGIYVIKSVTGKILKGINFAEPVLDDLV